MTFTAPADVDADASGRTGSAAAAVDAIIELLAVRPLHELSLEQVAHAADLPVGVVEDEFPDISMLVVAAVQEWNLRRMRLVSGVAAESGAIELLRSLLRISVADPACTCLVLTAAGVAGAPGHPAAPELRQQWVRFHAVVQRALVHDIEVGREPETMSPAHGAEQLLALYEGLQFQWLVRPHLDLLGAFDRAVTRLRDGWARAYAGSAWEL